MLARANLKANRTSLKGKRGIGLEKSLLIFDKIRNEVGVPVLTDVHTADQCSVLAAAINKYVCLHKNAGI